MPAAAVISRLLPSNRDWPCGLGTYALHRKHAEISRKLLAWSTSETVHCPRSYEPRCLPSHSNKLPQKTCYLNWPVPHQAPSSSIVRAMHYEVSGKPLQAKYSDTDESHLAGCHQVNFQYLSWFETFRPIRWNMSYTYVFIRSSYRQAMCLQI